MRVCVVGIGRMGLAIAAQFASKGADVIGCDVDAELVAGVEAGTVSCGAEPGLEARLREAQAAGRLHATVDTTAGVSSAEAVLVLVRMVTDADGNPDYTSLDNATSAIGAGLRPGTVVCYETTVPVGDTRGRFAPALASASGLRAGIDFHVCFSPERVSSGSIFRDLATYPKLVGGLTDACAAAGEAVYREHLDAQVWPLGSLEAAEFAKVAETTYRDVNIALANEFARYADELGIDVAEVIHSANSQPYSHIHQPGVGVGGHCIPVYPRFFMHRATDARLVTTARHINDEMPAYAVERLAHALDGLAGRRVLVLGLAFRADLPEASHSVAFAVCRELSRRGAEVRVHDSTLGRTAVEANDLTWGQPGDGWAEGAIIQAAHAEYRSMTPASFPGLRAILDGRGILKLDDWRRVGVVAVGIGATGG